MGLLCETWGPLGPQSHLGLEVFGTHAILIMNRIL